MRDGRLIEGVGAYSRGRLLDDHVSMLGAYSRVGAHSRGAPIRSITVSKIKLGVCTAGKHFIW